MTTVRIESGEWGYRRATTSGFCDTVYFGCPTCGAALMLLANGFITAHGLTLQSVFCETGCGAMFHAMFMDWRERRRASGEQPVAIRAVGFYSSALPQDVTFQMHRCGRVDIVPRATGTHHPALCQADGIPE